MSLPAGNGVLNQTTNVQTTLDPLDSPFMESSSSQSNATSTSKQSTLPSDMPSPFSLHILKPSASRSSRAIRETYWRTWNKTNLNSDRPWCGCDEFATRTIKGGYHESSQRAEDLCLQDTITQTSTTGGGTGAYSRNVASGVGVGFTVVAVGVIVGAP
jgi:hypothetical protein